MPTVFKFVTVNHLTTEETEQELSALAADGWHYAGMVPTETRSGPGALVLMTKREPV